MAPAGAAVCAEKRQQGGSSVYVLFAHPLKLRDLLADADFKALNTYIPTTFGDSVLVHGQRYKGMWDGVMIFETEMPTLTGAGAGHQCGP